MSDHATIQKNQETPAMAVVSECEIEAIVYMRRLLKGMARRHIYTKSTSEMRVLCKIEDAEGALFELLNVANAFCFVPVTPEQFGHLSPALQPDVPEVLSGVSG